METPLPLSLLITLCRSDYDFTELSAFLSHGQTLIGLIIIVTELLSLLIPISRYLQLILPAFKYPSFESS